MFHPMRQVCANRILINEKKTSPILYSRGKLRSEDKIEFVQYPVYLSIYLSIYISIYRLSASRI